MQPKRRRVHLPCCDKRSADFVGLVLGLALFVFVILRRGGRPDRLPPDCACSSAEVSESAKSFVRPSVAIYRIQFHRQPDFNRRWAFKQLIIGVVLGRICASLAGLHGQAMPFPRMA